MRFDLGAMIMVVTIAFSAWATWKFYGPARRPRGLRIEITAARPDEQKDEVVDP
jgi:hypothetical protein